jgi:hypothetical protein
LSRRPDVSKPLISLMETATHYCMCKARFTLCGPPRRPCTVALRARLATKELHGRLLSRIGRQSSKGDEGHWFSAPPCGTPPRRPRPNLRGAGRSQPPSLIAILGCSQVATQLYRCSAQLTRAATTTLIPMGCLSHRHVIKRVDTAGEFATSQAVLHRLMHRICGTFPEDSLILESRGDRRPAMSALSRRMISSTGQGMWDLRPVRTFVGVTRPRSRRARP